MVKVKIYTEDLNRESIESIVGKKFDGFTLIPAIGYWKGEKEKSLIIVIVSDAEEVLIRMKVNDIVNWLKNKNNQEQVMVEISHPFITFV